jgi:hypothetical protein
MVQLRTHPLGCVCSRCENAEIRAKAKSSTGASSGTHAEQSAALHKVQHAGAAPAATAVAVTEVTEPQRQEAAAATAPPPALGESPGEAVGLPAGSEPAHSGGAQAEAPRTPYDAGGAAPGARLSIKA